MEVQSSPWMEKGVSTVIIGTGILKGGNLVSLSTKRVDYMVDP